MTGRRKSRLPPSELSPAERRDKARAAALRLLARRERSAAELRQHLRRRGFDAQTATLVVAELREQGLQDDGRFAEAFAGSATGRGLAGRAIRGGLRARGISAELAAAAAAEPPEAEEQRARSLVERRAAGLEALPPEARLRRLVAYLGRRGYPPATCERLAREVVGGEVVDR